jgi:glycosyltransferase involved in cell wall biosynthesis
VASERQYSTRHWLINHFFLWCDRHLRQDFLTMGWAVLRCRRGFLQGLDLTKPENIAPAPNFHKLRAMFRDKKVAVVMPAYNAAKTLRQTYEEVREQGLVDNIILVDDRSRDDTVAVARSLEGVQVHVHEINKGYGGNQKTCYRLALEAGADIVIMIHPDYQYTPKLIPAMVSIIGNGLHPCVLGSRILGGYALKGGMPLWKYVSNRWLTFVENLLLGAKLSEYHTGYRAFSRELLQKLHLDSNSDDFVFDNQMLAQILWHGFTIAEVSCPTKYFAEASSINLRRSIRYGFGCLGTGTAYRLAKMGVVKSRLFA